MGLISRILKSIFRYIPKLFTWLTPFIRWIPSKLGILFNILFSYAKTILVIFFLVTIFMPVLTSLNDPDLMTVSQKAFAVFNGMGQTIATPDMAIATNIAILKSAETDSSISTLKPYSMLFRSAMELLAIFVVGFIFIGFINTNMSTKYGVGTILIIVILYSTTVMHHTGELPFYGLLWSEDSLLRNLDVFLNPIEPIYEFYNSFRQRFSSFDLVF
ncbi:MAG: hypothetical protein KAS32_09340 [Candidatus Peribacteraceae bacterium]|nr:hypothetical protein [Candidatus Peribacteraceae bacterium]